MATHGANFIQNVKDGLGNDINVMMVGIIQSYDENSKMATIIPQHFIPKQNIEYTPLVNVSIGFFSMGGFTIKVKPKVGDRLLILFCDYDIDNLLINGTKKNKTERTHALEDAIVLPLSINFLNEASNVTQDLVIQKEGTSAYVKITQDGGIVLDGTSIKLGENAIKGVVLNNGTNYIVSSKVYAE